MSRRQRATADIARHATPFGQRLETLFDYTLRTPQHAQRTRKLVAALEIGTIVIEAWSDESTFPTWRDARSEVRDGAELAPALVEADLRRLLAQREVAENLAALRATGAEVDYRRCDVGDADAFGALIDDVYSAHGRIDGVIHGAGVIEDRLIADKSSDSLARVLADS